MAQNAQFTKWKTHIFWLNTPASLYLFYGALPFGLLSSPKEIYVVKGFGIFVTEKRIYVTIVLGICALETYIWPVPRNDPEGMGEYTQST